MALRRLLLVGSILLRTVLMAVSTVTSGAWSLRVMLSARWRLSPRLCLREAVTLLNALFSWFTLLLFMTLAWVARLLE